MNFLEHALTAALDKITTKFIANKDTEELLADLEDLIKQLKDMVADKSK